MLLGNKYGLRGKKDLELARTMRYVPVKFGDYDALKKEARKLNREFERWGDRKFFVWPVGGCYLTSQLVIGYR